VIIAVGFLQLVRFAFSLKLDFPSYPGTCSFWSRDRRLLMILSEGDSWYGLNRTVVAIDRSVLLARQDLLGTERVNAILGFSSPLKVFVHCRN